MLKYATGPADAVTALHQTPLGQITPYVDTYKPDLLAPLPRQQSRAVLGVSATDLPFCGFDLWNAYEVSWLNERGKPQVALGELSIPCDSPCLVESKSLKLYLNSFNQTRFATLQAVQSTIAADLAQATGTAIQVRLEPLTPNSRQSVEDIEALCIDTIDCDIHDYSPNAHYLTTTSEALVNETLVSQLLKSNCPVTGQPDWATVFIRYQGRPISHHGLLQYVVSFRQHKDFHEHCVERIFVDILKTCAPTHLQVYARYARRGGLDINPYRSTFNCPMPLPKALRCPRQ